MSAKAVRYVYWIATGLLALIYLGAAAFYLSSYDMVAGMYREVLGYPTYIIWPLAILKVVGAVIILWRPAAMLADWAYAAMFWHLILAFGAHVGGLAACRGGLGAPDRLVADREPRARSQIGLCTRVSRSGEQIRCGAEPHAGCFP